MRRARFALLIMILALFTVSNSGCLMLMIPGLAYSGYQGYQTIEEKNTGTASEQESSKARAKPSSSPQDTSIE